MKIFAVIFMLTWIILFGYFIKLFLKNDMDLRKTFLYIKQNIFKCCLDKKKVEAVVGHEIAEEIQLNMANFDDCKKPVGFPLDICMSEELVKEEIIIREKLLKLLKNKDSYIIADGKKKLRIPLEATLFLTKSLNPLVNERGEIQITAKHRPVMDTVESLILELKESGDIIYQDDDELLEALKAMIVNHKSTAQTFSFPIHEKEPIKVEETIIQKETAVKKEDPIILNDDFKIDLTTLPLNKFEEEKTNKEEKIIQESKISKKDEQPKKETNKQQKGNLFEEEQFIEAPSLKKEKEQLKKNEDIVLDVEDTEISLIDFDPEEDDIEYNKAGATPFDDEDIKIDFSSIENEIDMELNDLTDMFHDSINSYEEEKKVEDVKDFYINLNYNTYTDKPLDFSNLKDSVQKLLSTDRAVGALFRNIAKTTPIIYNENKEVLFVDQSNVYFAIAKMYGMESKTYLDQFIKLKKEDILAINEGLSNALEIYLSDLISGTLKSGLYILENKEHQLFSSFGFCIQSKAFRMGLNHDEFDYFRSFPFDTDYKIKQAGGNKELTSHCSKLIFDMKSIEIK